jgi:hypothetical protein
MKDGAEEDSTESKTGKYSSEAENKQISRQEAGWKPEKKRQEQEKQAGNKKKKRLPRRGRSGKTLEFLSRN